MQALTLTARHGWRWLAAGFAIFRKNPPLLTLFIISYWLMMALLNTIPLLGAVAATLCIPAFSVSLMNACRDLDQGRPLVFPVLFSGFRSNLRVLLALGAIYFAATLGILTASSIADGGILFDMMLAGKPPSDEELHSGPFMAATQIALLLLLPLVMAYWYAPVLAAWHAFPAPKALFFSFVACLRNWRAFLAYGLAVVLFSALLPGLLLGMLVSLFPGSGNFLTALFTVPIFFVFMPTLFASFYVSYRDVFVAPGATPDA